MLSRTAEALFWVGRYTERTENHARLIDVNYHMRFNHRDGKEEDYKLWGRLIETIGNKEDLKNPCGNMSEKEVLHFLTFDAGNTNSIYSCVRHARMNVRAVREKFPSPSWDVLNGLFLWLKDHDMMKVMEYSPHDFFQNVKEQVALFHGVNDSLMLREKEWSIMQVGKYLERAENIVRIVLHIHRFILEEEVQQNHNANQYLLIALLRSLGAYEVYRKVYANELSFDKVIEFLLLNEQFPRSFAFSLETMETFSSFTELFAPVIKEMNGALESLLINIGDNERVNRNLLHILGLCNQLGVILSGIFHEEALGA